MTASLGLMTLIRASIEGGVLLLIVWALTRAWPRMPAAARCTLWWLGALRMIAGLVPIPTIAVPWKFAGVPAPAATWPKALPAPMVELGNAMAGATGAHGIAAPQAQRLDVIAIAIVALWLAGVLVGAALMIRRIAAIRRTWRNAPPFADARIVRWQNEWAVAIGRGRVPEVRASAEVHAPVAIGAIKPGLLLPLDSAKLSDDALRVVLAHEMSHIRRGDLLIAWVPAAAQMLFWFHPLVRFAAREYLAAREEVCDADALRATGVSPRDYGVLLVDYGVVRMSAVPGAACCGSRASRDLERRLDMLSRTVRDSLARRAGALAVTLAVLVLGFAPIRFVRADDDAKSSADYQRAVELERKAMLERQRAYDEAIAKTTTPKELEQLEARYKAAGQAYKDAQSYPQSRTAYAIKIKGRKGTRGAVAMADMDALEAIDKNDETVVYFRFGDEMWLSRDPEVLRGVTAAIAPEDEFEASQRASDPQRQAFENRERELEEQTLELHARRQQLEDQRLDLNRELGEAERTGKATSDLRSRQGELEDLNHELIAEEENLARARATLGRERESAGQLDKRGYAQRDSIHQKVMAEIERIGRQAIADGTATRYIP